MLYDVGSARGYALAAIDYRGYGLSTGEPTEQGLYEDAAAGLAYVRGTLGDPVVMLCANSLGCLVATKVAADDCLSANPQIARLCLDAPVGSISSIVSDATYFDVPENYLTTYEGNSAEYIRSVTIPLLWMHGTDDETLPYKIHGQPIWDNHAGASGAYIIVEGGTHETLPTDLGFAGYQERLRRFMDGSYADSLNQALYDGIKG
jgi:pimeloyl-ACP methyl ester carboxylesterase